MTLNSIDPADWPNQRMLGEWLFHRLRNVRKLERTIDEIKRSAYSSELRDFDFLWGRLQEHLVEEREDTNARSIELSLKPKSWRKDPKEKSNPLANPANAAAVPPPPPKETPAAPADPSSPKNDPKGKSGKGDKGKGEKGKGKGKGLSKEDKAKTPCVFFQMPSGCVRGSSCAYLHEKVKPDAKAEATAKPKAQPKPKAKAMAAVAIVAALSSMAMPVEGRLEFAAGTGAGRHLVSPQSLERQGVSPEMFSQFQLPSHESLRFSTGGGKRDSSDAIGLRDREGIFQEANHFALDSCPFVRSVGLDVSDGMGFLWLPNQLPCYIKACNQFQFQTDESNLIRASRVDQYVPYFSRSFDFIPGVPGEVEPVEAEPEVRCPEGAIPHSVADDIRGVAPGEALPKVPESEKFVRERELALSTKHCMTHFPKSALCDVCNRARLYSKRIRSHRRAVEESDLPVPEAFGQQIACDHMIVSKSSSGKEFVVLVVMDLFSKVFQAYPLATKDTDSVKEALNHFVGVKAKNPQTICKSDCAKELLKAIRSLGWLSDASLPRRWPHNSVLERQIRSFEESCRSMHLQAGFAVFPKLWTMTCQYTAVSMSIEHWSKAFGSEFKGADYILGQLVFYRTKFQEKSKLAPNSSPALMGGWKLEFGCRYKGVLRLVDYNSLKQGHVSVVVAPDQEVYVRDERVFPLRDLAEKALNDFSDPDVRQLADVDPLPIPFIEDTPETKSKARRVYITYSRMLKIGPTKGCKGCDADSSAHNAECIARYEEAFGAAPSTPAPEPPTFEMPEILGDLIDEEYTPTVLSEAEEDEEEIVPECPPPSDDEDEPEGDEARVRAGINAVLAMSHDAISKKAPETIVQETYASAVAASNESCLGAAAKPERLHSQIHSSPGGKILFEFACASDSALGRIGEELGVQVVRLCKEHIDLASKANIDQLVEQVKAIPGCSIHGSIECGPWSAWQRLNEAKNPRLSNILREKRRESVSMMHSFIRVANHVLDNGGFVPFEWPRYCSGWMSEPLASWITERQLLSATFDGCTVGITAKDNKPARKPWRFVTNNKRLADSLAERGRDS